MRLRKLFLWSSVYSIAYLIGVVLQDYVLQIQSSSFIMLYGYLVILFSIEFASYVSKIKS